MYFFFVLICIGVFVNMHCLFNSCILGELFLKKPLFQAKNEFTQLEEIRLLDSISPSLNIS